MPSLANPNPEAPAERSPVAVVTGGGRGIGAEYCRALADSGFRVVVVDVIDDGARIADELQAAGHEAIFHAADVTSEESTTRLAAVVEERLGQVDVLVNNAAVYQGIGRKRPFVDIPGDEWDRVMAVNVKGTWQVTKSLVPLFERRRYGRVVNITSSSVHIGAPGFAHYVASKGAVIALTRSMARELGAAGVTVNCIAPGLVENDASASLNDATYFANAARQRAVPRPMQPADLFSTLRFLASPDSGFITGQTIVVDGGQAFL